MRKIAFSHCEVYKVHCACAVSRPVHRGPPKTTRNNFLTSTYLYNFYGATVTIKGSFILEHLYVKTIFGRKKNKVKSKSVPKWRFFGNLRVYILIVVIMTPKRHILGRNDVFWRIFRKNPFRGVGCSELQEPKKR